MVLLVVLDEFGAKPPTGLQRASARSEVTTPCGRSVFGVR